MALLPLVKLALPFVLSGLEYLRQNSLLPDAPDTGSADAPYTPPFAGGQCVGVDYRLKFSFNELGAARQNGSITVKGAVKSVANYEEGDRSGIRVVDGLNITREITFGLTTTYNGYTFDGFERVDGGIDNCGDVPNPDPSAPIPDGGIPSSPAPDLTGDGLKVVTGAPLLVLPNFAAALAAALAAARAAANALDAIKAIADAIDALKDLLEKLADALKEDDEEDDDKKDVLRYEFGSIRRDGFLRLYPDDNVAKYSAEQLDISAVTLPVGFGKYFGKFSPNYYRFREIGYISFVSATFGVLEVRSVQFTRCSFQIPDDCIGFFYHLGLDGAIIANAVGYYTKPQEQPPE